MEAAPQVENAPPAFHILAKPAGATCNLDCTYCFFLSKEMLYPGSRFRMADELLEKYIQQLIESHRVPEVTIAWQGGEPTLMGLDFFKRSIEYQNKHKKPGMRILNTIQTNGVLLDDEWAAFFKENEFLVGISIDGPREMHDAYRVDKGGEPTFDRVIKGLSYLQKHEVDFNVLTTVHAANGDNPVEVYRFLRDEVGAEFIQFIPIIERGTPETMPIANKGWGGTLEDRPLYINDGSMVTVRSIGAEQYGNFLIGVFDEWVRHDVGQVYVQIFDVSLGSWVGAPPALCIFSPTCGNALAMEHNGDVYSCDHFVEPDYLLGNIEETHMIELVASDKQRQFGKDKFETLPQYCLDCDVRFACHGGCPKNRFIETPDGEPGLNYLCAGYKAFFHHIDHPMKIMGDLLRQNRAPAEIMIILEREEDARLGEAFSKTRRNEPCPCGSGKKFKQCHGRS
jgi:uncharacterized protein